MAVDANTYEQNVQFGPALKPSNIAAQNPGLLADFRRALCVPAVAAGPILTIEAPWAGVIERIQSTQILAGGGAAQNILTLTVGGVNCLAAAADGNTFLGNVAAGTTSKNYPTDNLTASADLVDRVAFNKGDVIALGVGGANHGTCLYEMDIAKSMPQSV